MTTRKFLITGAAGLIGSRIADHLRASGHRVSGTYRNTPGRPEIAIRWTRVDLEDPGSIEAEIAADRPDCVIHCAAQQPRAHLSYPGYEGPNVLAVNHLLDAMKKHGVRNLLHFSTAVIHAFPEEPQAIREDSPVLPGSLYALSKYCGEQLVRLRSQADGLHALCFRIPSLLLPEQKGGLIHSYYEAALRGDDLELYSGGRYFRNVLALDDLLRACDGALERLHGDDGAAGFHPFLLGSANSLRMEEIARRIYDRLGSSGRVRPVEKAAPVKGHWILDLGAARDALGFRPRTLEQNIDHYLERMRR